MELSWLPIRCVSLPFLPMPTETCDGRQCASWGFITRCTQSILDRTTRPQTAPELSRRSHHVSAPRLTVCSFRRWTKTGMTWEDFDRLTCRSRSGPTLDGTSDALVASRMAFVPFKAASFL